MLISDIEDQLNELLAELMPDFTVEKNDEGQLVIMTGLAEDADGEIIDFEDYKAIVIEDDEDEEDDNEDDE